MLNIIKNNIYNFFNKIYVKLYFSIENIYIYIYEFNYGGYLFTWFTTKILYYISYTIKYTITIIYTIIHIYCIVYNVLIISNIFNIIIYYIDIIKYFLNYNLDKYIIYSLLGLIILYSFRFILV